MAPKLPSRADVKAAQRPGGLGLDRPPSPSPKVLVWPAVPTLNTNTSSCLLR